jgi:hypothetical protein
MQYEHPDKAIIGLTPDAKHIRAAERKSQRAFKNGVPLEAIAYSSCSENMYKNINVREVGWK